MVDHFENGGFTALLDREIVHRTSPLEAVEATQSDKWVEENPQQLSLVVEKLESELGIETRTSKPEKSFKKKTILGEDVAEVSKRKEMKAC